MIFAFSRFSAYPVLFYLISTVTMSAWEYFVGWLLETTTQRQAAGTIAIGCAAEQDILTEVWPRVVSRRETDARLAVSAAVELHQIIDLSTQES